MYPHNQHNERARNSDHWRGDQWHQTFRQEPLHTLFLSPSMRVIEFSDIRWREAMNG